MNSLHAWGKQINHALHSGTRTLKHNGHHGHHGGQHHLHGAVTSGHNGTTKLSHSTSSDSGCSEIHTSSSEQECHKLGINHHHHHHHHHQTQIHHHPHHQTSQQQQQQQQVQQQHHLSPTTTTSPGCAAVADSCLYVPPWQAMISVTTFVEFVKNRDVGRIKYAIREADFSLDSHDEVGSFYYIYFFLYSCC